MTLGRSSNSLASLALLLLLAATLPLPLGCNTASTSQATPPAGSASASAAAAQASASAIASALPKPDRRGRGQGPAGTLFREARALELSDPQKATLDTLETDRESGEAPGDEFKDLQTDVVAGIRAGKLDKPKLQSDFSAVDTAAAARQAKEETALSGLYAALDPAQRKAVVAAVRAKEAARDAHLEGHPDADAGTAEWAKRRLARMTEQLKLDPTQQKTVEGILVKGDATSPASMKAMADEGKKRMDAVLTAFEGNAFDPKKLDLTGVPGKTPHEGLEKDVAFLGQLLPVLTPDQREKLASQRERSGMRRHPDGREGRGGPMGGPGGGGPGGGGGSNE